MRVSISLVLGLVVLISGSVISQSHAEAGELGEHELPNPGIAEKEIGRQVRKIETEDKVQNGEEQTSASTDDRDIPEVSTDGTNKKRHVSFSMCGSPDEPCNSDTVARGSVVLPSTSSELSSCDCGESVFTSKVSGCFTKIFTDLNALLGCAKQTMMNLKSEMSLGPQRGECLNDNAAAANFSLIMTRQELQSFMDRCHGLLQVAVREPEQLWTVSDAVSSSVPTNKISLCVSNLHDHIMELLGVVKEWLCTNDKAMAKIQVIENRMASLCRPKFARLDKCAPCSSPTVPPARIIISPGGTFGTRYVNYPIRESPRAIVAPPACAVTSDLGMAKKFKTIRSLCSFIRQVPVLLIELMAVLKNSLITIHENGGLCEKLRNHPLFSLPACNCLLPEREGITVFAPEPFHPDPEPSPPAFFVTPFGYASGQDWSTASGISSASQSSPSGSNNFVLEPPPTITNEQIFPSQPSNGMYQFNDAGSFGYEFSQPEFMLAQPDTPSSRDSSSYKDVVSTRPEPLGPALPSSNCNDEYAQAVAAECSPDCTCEAFTSALAGATAKVKSMKECVEPIISKMVHKTVSCVSSLSSKASGAIPPGKICGCECTSPGSSAPPAQTPEPESESKTPEPPVHPTPPRRVESEKLYRDQEVTFTPPSPVPPMVYYVGERHDNGCCLKNLLHDKLGNCGCNLCNCKRKFQSSSSGTQYAPVSLRPASSARFCRESVSSNERHARKRRFIPSYSSPNANSPSTRSITTPSSSRLPLFPSFLLKPSNILAALFATSASLSSSKTDASLNSEVPFSLHFSEPSSTPGSKSSSFGPSSNLFIHASDDIMKPLTDDFNAPANGGGTFAAGSPESQAFDNLVRPATFDFNGPTNDASASPPAPSASKAISIPYGALDFDEDSHISVY